MSQNNLRLKLTVNFSVTQFVNYLNGNVSWIQLKDFEDQDTEEMQVCTSLALRRCSRMWYLGPIYKNLLTSCVQWHPGVIILCNVRHIYIHFQNYFVNVSAYINIARYIYAPGLQKYK